MSNNPPYSYTTLRNTPYILNYLYEGQVYVVYHEFDNAFGTSYIQITTGARIVHIFNTTIQTAGGGDVTLSMYENVTLTSGSTQPNMPPRSFDRRIGETVPALSTLYTDPTGVDLTGATLISRSKVYGIGGGQGGNDIAIDTLERVLAPNTTYLVTLVVSGQAVDIACTMQFYESGN